MQYRASLALFAFGHFVLTGVEFLALWSLFERFGNLKGWSLAEVALLYGMANIAFALAESAARGFDVFDQMVKSGAFDRLLLRPLGTAFQVGAQELQLMRIGRFAQGAAVTAWAVASLDLVWSPAKAVLIAVSVLSGACIFSGLFILQATLAFWTTESLEIVNTVTYGGVETAQYPISIYRVWFRRFFTWVIPLAAMNYFPVVAVTGKPDPLGTPGWLVWISPLFGFLFLLVCLRVWRFGEKRYRSTGS
jgi:ABC-2 type transport system permease protein